MSDQVVTDRARMWVIKLWSKQPVELQDTEYLTERDVRDVIARCMMLVARTSFMVGQPNREVYWSISVKAVSGWRSVMNGRSKVRDRPIGARYPSALG
jgi:hypothetical protein